MHSNKADSFPITSELLSSLRLFILRHTRNANDVDDILQDVLVKVLRKGGTVSPAKFIPWLHKVSKTTAIDHYRKNRLTAAEVNEEKRVSSDLPAESENQLTKCIRPLIQKLSPEDSRIIMAVDLNGESQTELARKNGLNYSAIKSKVQRARQRLKSEILKCCQVELDRRNSLFDVKPNNPSGCC